MKNYHIIQSVYVGCTNRIGSRIKLTSHRFKHSKYIPFGGENWDAYEVTMNWFNANGFIVVGFGEGLKGYYFICETFKPLN